MSQRIGSQMVPRLHAAFSALISHPALLPTALALMIPAALFAQSHPGSQTPSKSQPRFGNALPLVFEENLGQMPAGTAFAGRTQQYTVELRPDDLRFHLAGTHSGRDIDVSFSGTNGGKPSGVEQAGFQTNLYLGNDPAKWHTGVRNYDRVALRALYPGIDVEFYAERGEIEHDFMVAAGASTSRLAMHLAGAKSVTLTPQGDVLLAAEDGSLRLRKPDAYQVLSDGKRHSVEASFALESQGGEGDLSFKLGAYDHSRELVIDPVITYATYIAGDSGSNGAAIASDKAGNVYVTGQTSSPKESFQAASVASDASANPAAGTQIMFLAKLAKLAAATGTSEITWLTYYGTTSGSTAPAAIALQPSTSTVSKVFVGGNTAPGVRVSSGAFTPSPGTSATGSSYGYIASFSPVDGTFGTATYVDGQGGSHAATTTAVTALAANATQITAVGETTGNAFATTVASSTTSAALISAPNGLVNKGLIVTLDPTLATEMYGTYLCGDTCATAATTLTGVAIDGAAPIPNIYVSGSTVGDFPKAGQYVAANSAATPPVAASTPAMYTPPATKTGLDSFVAEIKPATKTLIYSLWTNGAADDEIEGVALDTTGDLYAFGDTASAALLGDSSSGVLSTTILDTPNAVASPPAITSLDPIYPAGATQAGFVLKVDSTGKLLAATYLSGASASTAGVAAGAVDATANLYLTGASNSKKADFPQATTGSTPANGPVTGLVPLPAGEDLSTGTTGAVPNVFLGYLLQLDPTLSTVENKAYFGPPSGSSSGTGIAQDGAGNTYVLINETDPSGSGAFTTASAAQTGPYTPVAPSTSTASAYIAQLQFATASTPALAPVTSTTSTNVYYQGASALGSQVTLTWQLKTGADPAAGVVFNLPPDANIEGYSASSLPSFSTGGTPLTTATCTVGVASSANTSPGITCVVPSLAANSTLTITLATKLSSTTISGTGFTVPAMAFDAQGDSISLASQTVVPNQEPSLLLDDEVTVASPVNAGPPPIVNAVLTATDSVTPNALVTYTYTISNLGAPASVAASGVHLNTALPASFHTITATSSTACDPTATAGCSIPAGIMITYTVTGSYVGGLVDPTGALTTSPFPETIPGNGSAGAPSITFTTSSDFSPVATSSGAQTVSVQGVANVTATITPGGFTFPAGSGATGYTLGDKGRTLLVTLTNRGPNLAGKAKVTVMLPQGFVATSSTVTSGTGEANCTVAPFNVCTFDNLSGLPTGVGATPGTASFTITGAYSDTGTTADAVAPPTASGGTAVSVQNSSISSLSTEAATVPASAIVVSGNTFANPSLAASTAITVTRVNTLGYTITASTPTSTPGPTITINETNQTHVNDKANYAVTLANSGAGALSVARGLYFTIPIGVPNNPAITAASSVALSNLAVVSPTGYPILTCTPLGTTAAAIVCYTTDLTGGTAVPAPAQAGTSYTVTFTASYDETSIPATQTNGMLPLTQTAGTFFAASDSSSGVAYNSNPAGVINTPTANASASITLQRATSLSEVLQVTSATGEKAPATFSDQTDINLDEHTISNAPGVNDTVVFVATTQNAGPNDALGATLTIPVPKDLLVLSVPANCVLTTPAGSTPGPTLANTAGLAGTLTGAGGTMTCTPPTTTTPTPPTSSPVVPPTYVSQIASCLSASVSGAPCPPVVTSPATVYVWNKAVYPYATVSPSIASNGAVYAVTFAAKYVDTALGTDTIPGLASTGTEAFTVAAVGGTDVDTAKIISAVPPAMTVQRAAHVYLSSLTLPAPTYTDGSAIPLVSGIVEVAQAAPGMDYKTGIANTNKIYNCERFSVPVLNYGPNYAVGATLTYAINQGTFVPTQTTNAANSNLVQESPLNCGTVGTAAPGVAANGTQTALLGTLGYATTSAIGNTGDAYLDGYFDLGALGTSGDMAATTFSTETMSGSYKDSNQPGTTSSDYVATLTETLVNTPFNTFGGKTAGSFSVTPTGTAIPVTLAFSTAAAPGGITTASATATAVGASLPKGLASAASPYPLDNGIVKPLYQAGTQTPYTYSAATTAAVGATGFCVNGAGTLALPDLFVKPERVLMWSLSGTPNGTTFNNVPILGQGTPSSNLLGDVTSNVISSGTAYTQIGSVALPQKPQAQPQRVCGVLGGLPAPGSAPLSIAVLEPINFPPYVVGTVTSSAQPAKGSTVAQATATLTTSPYLASDPTGSTHDFNDSDPCYLGGTANAPATRTSTGGHCDDNPYLVAWLYGGGNIQGASAPIETPVTTTLASLQLGPGFNLSGGGEVFIAVSDQATGVDSSTSTPIQPSRGNFFLIVLAKSTTSADNTATTTECDPGIASANYTPVLPCISETPLTGTLGSVGNQLYVRGGLGYALGNVGVQGFTATALLSSPGLVPLPFPDGDPTSDTGGAPFNPGGSLANPLGVCGTTVPCTGSSKTTAAIITVTPGQSAGFSWPWLLATGYAHGAAAGDVYDLTCVSVDSRSLTQNALPSGIGCNISATTQSSATGTSATFTFGSNELPGNANQTFPCTSTAAGVCSSGPPTILISTSGNQFARSTPPDWNRAGKGIALALLLPVFLFRRRLSKGVSFVVMLISLAAAPLLLSGCGAGTSAASTGGPAVAPGSYLFRAVATPEASAKAKLPVYTAVFEVVVQAPN